MADGNRKFMGSVLVARDGQVILSRGYGFANLEWDVPNTPDTRFRLGSISKQFTAACILKLEEQGKLQVADPVKKYLPDAPPAWDKITIHHVLTHTAGIPSFTSFPEYPRLKLQATTLEKTYAQFRDKPLEFEPGTKWNYSNSGFLLLSYLVEKIAGQKYDEFLKRNVIGPAGMNDSGYDLNATVLKHRASGYSPFGTILLNAEYINMTLPSGAGALYSTTEDLLRWEQALFGGKVVSTESLRKMTTPNLNNYAYGLAVNTGEGHKRIGHGGGIEGFNTQLNYYPDDKVVVVVLGNVNGNVPGQIASRLGALAMEASAAH
jgi:CubicO group peptidase (beta-lactamase class C family)